MVWCRFREVDSIDWFSRQAGGGLSMRDGVGDCVYLEVLYVSRAEGMPIVCLLFFSFFGKVLIRILWGIVE